MSYESGITTAVEVKPAGAAIVVAATGGNITMGSEVIPVHCIGQMNPFDLTTGPVTCTGRIDFIVQSKPLLVLAQPDDTSKVLNTFDVTIGTYKISTCKMSSLSLTAAVEDVLKGSFSFIGLVWSTTTNPTKPTAVPGYQSWTMVATNLGTYQANTLDVTIDNNVNPIHFMGVADPARNAQYVAEGYQSIKFNARLVQAPTIPTDITADALTKIAAPVFTFTDTAAIKNTLTITFTNALAAEIAQDLDPEDLVRYGINYEATAVAFT